MCIGLHKGKSIEILHSIDIICEYVRECQVGKMGEFHDISLICGM